MENLLLQSTIIEIEGIFRRSRTQGRKLVAQNFYGNTGDDLASECSAVSVSGKSLYPIWVHILTALGNTGVTQLSGLGACAGGIAGGMSMSDHGRV